MGRQTTTYAERVQMDMFYIDHWSIWLDLVIIANVLASLKSEGAYDASGRRELQAVILAGAGDPAHPLTNCAQVHASGGGKAFLEHQIAPAEKAAVHMSCYA